MSKKNDSDLAELAGWIISSSYRKRVMVALGEQIKTPSVLSKHTGIVANHISTVIRQLKDKELVLCINEKAYKGRLYQITDLGKEVMKIVKRLE